MSKKDVSKGIIQFNEDLHSIASSTSSIDSSFADAIEKQTEQRTKQNELLAEINALAEQMGVIHERIEPSTPMFSHLDRQLEDYYCQYKTVVKRFPDLTPVEWIYASLSGIISVAIDVIFVGTPEVVKIYKGGENFDGSRLTAILREIGTDPDSKSYAVFHWLSDKCKVPYDLSAVKDVMYPNNHRIRSLGHDPFLGLFFAVADILLGTTTCIDNSGHIQILVGKHAAPMQEKLLAVFYYIGHIFSDICTARGIPVPGFFLPQFFAGDGTYNSIAKKAELMYLDGYDMRHLASTSVPVIVKNLLIDAYLMLSKEEIDTVGIAEKEIAKQQAVLKKEKMIFISDCIATGGNLTKILLPPSCGNPASINLTQWAEFIRSSISIISAATRDMSVERTIEQRKDIDATWEQLLSE